MDRSNIVGEVFLRIKRSSYPIVCNVSNRHAHLTEDHIRVLFGRNYKLEKLRDLQQPGEYASTVTVDIEGPKSLIKKVRVLGPARSASQVEVTRTDCFSLGIKTEVRNSGDISGTCGIRLIGPAGQVMLGEGLIVAQRHVHMTPHDADVLRVKDRQRVRIRTKPPRSVVFEDVVVRVSDKFSLECHLDTDEANACDLKNGQYVFLS